MKVAIITQPLLNNYGGLLQNFAVQRVLKRLGHRPETIDYLPPKLPLWILICSWLRTIIFFFIPGRKRGFISRKKKLVRYPFFETFVKKYIDVSDITRKYHRNFFLLNRFDSVIVGSDQVWRPKYNFYLKDMYLNFLKKVNIKKVAYAASFGVDNWEYTPKQTKVCSALAKKFNAISVREESGIKLCNDHLGVDATWVLDPTLLLKKEDYLDLCSDVSKEKKDFLAVYMLDVNNSIKSFCETEAKKRKLVIKYFTADAKSTLSVPEWLAMFRDASYVVTDSFHGTVFSIIFEKEFKCIYNESRGAARFESLLNLYNSGRLEEMREFSLNWLKIALDS